MPLKNDPEWNRVSETINIQAQNNFKIDNNKCFDQLRNIHTFLKEKQISLI